jgi:hypothetical protein
MAEAILYAPNCQSVVVVMESPHIHSLTNHTSKAAQFLIGDVYRSISANSVQVVFDLGTGNWFTDGICGDKALLTLKNHCCSPTSVLFTTFVGIFNRWMRIITSGGSHPAFGEFIDMDTRLLSGERIYRYPIGAALHQRNGIQPDSSLDEMLGKSMPVD